MSRSLGWSDSTHARMSPAGWVFVVANSTSASMRAFMASAAAA
ncbi:MAG: hypothetical protein NTW19_13680 [Planctomycetota bacterium]|nr:hypothetical protein [Planctomycetota bacterium]